MNAPSQTGRPHLAVRPSPENLTVDEANGGASAVEVNSTAVPVAPEVLQIYGGPKDDLGHVSRQPWNSFEKFVSTIPVQEIPISRAEFHRRPKADRDRLKRVDYIVAATFKLSPSPRKTVFAEKFWVVILDVDDLAEGRRMREVGFDVLLGDLAAVVWHTANSTPDEPRLRIVVLTNGIPVSQYPAAVEALAAKLGMASVTPESKTAVQPMFLPTRFKGEPTSKMVYAKSDGCAFDPGTSVALAASPAPAVDPLLGNIEHLRAPMDGVTKEVAKDVLSKFDADCSYTIWIMIGMALMHQFGDAGLDLWIKWSSRGKKFPGRAELEAKWKTFEGNCQDREPVTFRSVIKIAKDNGWDGKSLQQQIMKEARNWIRDDDRTADELRSESFSRIARLGLPSRLARDEILHDLADALRKKSGTKPSIATLRNQLQEELRKHRQATPTSLPPWAKDLVYVGGRFNEFYSLKDGYQCPPETFDHEHERDMDGDDIAPHDFVLNQCLMERVQDYSYHPGRDQIFTDERDFSCVNTYRRSYATADTTHVKKAMRLLKRHLVDLIKEPEYRRTVMDFIAYLVQHPGEKILWALLIQGVEGCGKGTIADLAAAVLGTTNVRRLEAGAALDSQFNDFAAGSQLVVFDEVRNVGENKFRVMENLKPLITDPFVELNRKYQRQRNVANVANYMLFTNHHDALPVSDDDRRFFILKSPLQTKGDLAAHDVTGRCKELHEALQAHPGAFRALFEAHKISTTFDPKGRAPDTPYRQELSRAGESPLKAEIRDLLGAQTPFISRDLLSIGNLAETLCANNRFVRPPIQTISNILLEMSYVRVGEARINGPSHRLWARRGAKFEGDLAAATAELKYRIQCDDILGPVETS